MKKYCATLCAMVMLALMLTVGCGPDNSTMTTAPPPPMTDEQIAEQNAHYAQPSDRDRQ
jgi:hypothetical protein